MTKTNNARTNKQNVAEVFNRLVWPIIGELVKLSAISCFYYRSTFSSTGVTRLCVVATRHSCESWDDIMLANVIFVAAVSGQLCEFRCKAAVDWMTWASTSLLARWTLLTQRAAKRRFARRRSTSSNWDKVGGYGPTLLNIDMGVKYKIKECLWSESPGYFFLASLRPPNYCLPLPIISAGPITELSGWQLPMRDECRRVGKWCAYTILYRHGGLVHDTKTLSHWYKLHWVLSFLFSFFPWIRAFCLLLI